MARVCPRCAGPVQEPGLWSSNWRCDDHGAVEPLNGAVDASQRSLDHLVSRARVPVWIPDPPPAGFLVSGFRHAGDDRSGATAVVVAVSGPHPVGEGPADVLFVAEEPGVGVGAWYAGIPGPDPGPPARVPADGFVVADGHATRVWRCPEAPGDRAVYTGEAKGLWLWVVLHPPTADLLLLEELRLTDARDGLTPPVFGARPPVLGT